MVRSFHNTIACFEDNFYHVLGLEPGTSNGAIKKQFYALSKTHHPDRNPDDPHAAARFMRISEAYAIIGNSEKRERYDRDVIGAQQPSPYPVPRGTHSSSSRPFGARPASGLSRRRTQFKGPPPSFYRNGAWGAHGARRQAQAHGESAPTATSSRPPVGFGVGQGQAGLNNDVPHFDQLGHYRTQQSHEQRWKNRKREDTPEYGGGGAADVAMRFLIVSGIVGLAYVPLWAYGQRRSYGRGKAIGPSN